jgi:hypothetical protein
VYVLFAMEIRTRAVSAVGSGSGVAPADAVTGQA